MLRPSNQPARKTRKVSTYKTVLALLLVLVIGSIAIYSLKQSNTSSTAPVTAPKPNAIDEGVLTILSMDRKGSPVAQGSGFILTADGLAASNYHVLKGAAAAVAECCNGRRFEIGAIEGADLVRDLVVFQLYEQNFTVKPHNLPYKTIGSSKDVAVGDKVIAIGSPQGLENTVSDGIVSAIRQDESVRYLQITAPISPGSSGGPVLGPNGQVIGVATLQLEGGQNLNFAVGVEYLSPLLDEHYEVSLSEFQSIVRKPQHERNAVSNEESTEAQAAQAPILPLAGVFGGVVHNQSVDMSAQFAIAVTNDQGALTGCMFVQEPLFGSGPLNGIASDSYTNFSVTSAIGTIWFVGQRDRDEITGTYTVKGAAPPDQVGTFTLQKSKARLPVNFDPINCPTDADVHSYKPSSKQ
jgi:S1-C subfamily serine protease